MASRFKENPFDDLYRIIDIVARARYNAQRRLMIHSALARFAMTFSTIALIIIPLLDLGGFNRHYTPRYVQIMQIVFAVVLLAYSLLLGMAQFEIRADRMHQNGLILSRMLRELKLFIGATIEGKETSYSNFVTRYYDTLEKAENFRQVDYYSALLTEILRDGVPEKGAMKTSKYLSLLGKYLLRTIRMRARIYSVWLLIFSHYILSVVLIYGWVVFMVR